MTDVTSFETTKKLLEAGFPRSNNWGLQYSFIDEKSIHSASALDILKQLPVGYVIGFDSVGECWMCYLADSGPVEVCFSKNPAEAAAEMYLKVNS